MNASPINGSPEVDNMNEIRALSEQIIGLSGKVDGYMAAQNVAQADHERRITEHGRLIDELRQVSPTHVTREELRDMLADRIPAKVQASGWTAVGTVVQAVVGLGTLLGILILLIDKVSG